MPITRPTLPAWWNRDLYSFLGDMPIEGWIWEFMRRARLQKVLVSRPVDAMNPSPKIKNIDKAYINLYKHWNHPYWRCKGVFSLRICNHSV